MRSMVVASWKEYSDTASELGNGVTTERAGQLELQVSEGAFAAKVREMQESHPLFDTGALVDALETRLTGLARARQ